MFSPPPPPPPTHTHTHAHSMPPIVPEEVVVHVQCGKCVDNIDGTTGGDEHNGGDSSMQL